MVQAKNMKTPVRAKLEPNLKISMTLRVKINALYGFLLRMKVYIRTFAQTLKQCVSMTTAYTTSRLLQMNMATTVLCMLDRRI